MTAFGTDALFCWTQVHYYSQMGLFGNCLWFINEFAYARIMETCQRETILKGLWVQWLPQRILCKDDIMLLFTSCTDKNSGSLGCFGWTIVIISMIFVVATFPLSIFICLKVEYYEVNCIIAIWFYLYPFPCLM